MIGRGRSIDPERLAFLHQQAERFSVTLDVPGDLQDMEHIRMQLYLEHVLLLDQFEEQTEQHVGKLLHQERVTLRALLMGRLRSLIDQACGQHTDGLL